MWRNFSGLAKKISVSQTWIQKIDSCFYKNQTPAISGNHLLKGVVIRTAHT